MHGVVSLLDDEHYELVEGIWAELARDFGVRGIYVTPFPHFSYRVAESLDAEAVETALRATAQTTAPFKIHAAGLGIFNATHPVLYIPIVRSPALAALHERLWHEIEGGLEGVARYYHPEMWMPHVTLAHGDVDYEKLLSILRALQHRQFHWEMTVNNLSLIYDTGMEQGLRCRFNFGGGGSEEGGDTPAP